VLKMLAPQIFFRRSVNNYTGSTLWQLWSAFTCLTNILKLPLHQENVKLLNWA
jgi:hypothetical protein